MCCDTISRKVTTLLMMIRIIIIIRITIIIIMIIIIIITIIIIIIIIIIMIIIMIITISFFIFSLGEAWANIGAIHMHKRTYDKALHALSEAKKHKSRYLLYI